MLEVDKYIQKRHSMKDYNCWDFIREVWIDLTGIDIGHRTPTNLSRKAMKERFEKEEYQFKRLTVLQDPCLLLFKRNKILPHVGVYYKGKVLHLPEKSNGKYEPLDIASLGFQEVRYYTYAK